MCVFAAVACKSLRGDGLDAEVMDSAVWLDVVEEQLQRFVSFYELYSNAYG